MSDIRIRKPSLLCLSGPDEGKRFMLSRGPNTIGTGQGAVTLRSAGVEALHARIDIDDSDSCVLRNLSTRGTLCNGRRVDVCELKVGDSIQIGEGAVFTLEGRSIVAAETNRNKASKVSDAFGLSRGVRIGVLAYLSVLAIAGVLFALWNPEQPETSVDYAQVQTALRETRRIVADDAIPNLDLLLENNEARALLGGRRNLDPELRIAELMTALEGQYREAWFMEKQGRYVEAIDTYRRIASVLPDPRIPITLLAEQRIAALNSLAQIGKSQE